LDFCTAGNLTVLLKRTVRKDSLVREHVDAHFAFCWFDFTANLT